MSLAVLMLCLMIFLPLSVSWWNADWDYRNEVNITENSGQDLINHQTRIEMNTSELVSRGDLQASCEDLRFIDSDDSDSLDYWLESGCGTESTTVWVEVPELSANEEKRIYAYYGNDQASSGTDGNSTFMVFDDFTGDTISEQWTDINSGTSLSQSEGRLEITKGNVHSANKDVVQPETVVEARLKYASSIDGDDSGLMIADSGSMSGSNSNGNANVLFISDDSSGTVSTWSGDGETTSYNICSGVNVFTASQGENYIYGIKDTGSQVMTSLNYDEKVSCSGDLTSQHTDFVIGLGDFSLDSESSTTSVSYDWVRTRKHVSTQPSVEVGSEKSRGLCDSRGPENECILNSSRQISQNTFTVDSVFQAGTEAYLNASEGNSMLNITNSSSISGLWEGGIEFEADKLVLTSGARFRPQDERINLRVR